MIFVAEHFLGTCLNSPLQAQRGITVLACRVNMAQLFLDCHAGSKVLGFKKTFWNVEDA